MTRNLVFAGLAASLTACASVGILNEPPRVTSPDTSVQVTINKAMPADSNENLIFTINDEEIYGFGRTRSFPFVIDAGSYLFGYRMGSSRCETEVDLNGGYDYVFNLGPDCLIEMEQERPATD